MNLYSQSRLCDCFVYGVLYSKTHRLTIIEDVVLFGLPKMGRFMEFCLRWRFYGFFGWASLLGLRWSYLVWSIFKSRWKFVKFYALKFVKIGFRKPDRPGIRCELWPGECRPIGLETSTGLKNWPPDHAVGFTQFWLIPFWFIF